MEQEDRKIYELQKWADEDCESIDLDDLEEKLESDLEEQMQDLQNLEIDHEKIGNPNSVGETVIQVVWEQFINQVGVIGGEDFVKENRGLSLDLRNSAHIQTTENFADGKIASHNTKIDYQQRYDDWQSNFQRNEDGSIKKERARITGEWQEKLKPGARNYLNGPKGSASMHNDHTIPAAEIIRDPEANAHLSREEQHDFAVGEINYQPLDASANESKRDIPMKIWLNSKRNGQEPADRFNINKEELIERDDKARAEYKKRKEEGEQRSIETGKQSQKEEAFRIGGKALRAVIMELLASLIKDVICKLIVWFRAGNRKLNTFVGSVKDAITSFVFNIKERLLNGVALTLSVQQ